MKSIFNNRYYLFYSFILSYLFLSFILRIYLYLIVCNEINFSFLLIIKTFLLGLLYDLEVALLLMIFYQFYLLIIPKKLIGTFLDKLLTYLIFVIVLFISLFAFISEIPFWKEFSNRFNFIAVDYLIYTYEVIENINQSYPIPLIFITLFFCIGLIIFIYHKSKIFFKTFNKKINFKNRLLNFLLFLIITTLGLLALNNKQAEFSKNNYVNELSKNGVFSFFAAYRSNELDFDLFYAKINEKLAYNLVKKNLKDNNQIYTSNKINSIERKVVSNNEIRPNIILICVESLSANYLKEFGNSQNLTPKLDSLASKNILFTNLYATGTRTVRGIEALTLCVPPTPGNSIVRRQNIDNLYSISSILKTKNYSLNFIYGGDGYFDNMNAFFSKQGFDITDRDRGNPLLEENKTTRHNIETKDVTFENAWGVCDEDIYNQAIKCANNNISSNKPFFQFIMTTSNHKPYTFPENRIKLAQGNRESAVNYTDFALGNFIKKASKESWFSNTVFIIIADHCASSAGKWEINIEKHHIPAIVINLPNNHFSKINELTSQIDIMPTIFGMLNWSYNSSLMGKDVLKSDKDNLRAFIGNYRTLGMLKNNYFTQINDRNQITQYKIITNKREEVSMNNTQDSLKNLTISYYQIASHRFKNGLMKNSLNIN